jgi:hypothetical protein
MNLGSTTFHLSFGVFIEASSVNCRGSEQQKATDSMDRCNTDYKDAVWAFYRFEPSVEANVVFVVLFSVSTLLHIFQIFRTRTWYLTALVAGGCGTSTTT